MLTPNKQKYRKAHKGRVKSVSKAGNELSFGQYGLKSLSMDRVNSRQLEAARRAAVRSMKRLGKLWIKVFPDIPVTKKAC
jgi:large subunit ribosomal protein L16